MIRREVTIVNALGLHARAAARFVQTAGRFRSRIEVCRDGRIADGKSILSLLALLCRQGTRVTVGAEGADEQEALGSLCALVEGRFGEEA